MEGKQVGRQGRQVSSKQVSKQMELKQTKKKKQKSSNPIIIQKFQKSKLLAVKYKRFN